MNKVICVGNAVVDIIVKNGPDRTPDGMTQFSESIDMYVGGDAVNEAVGLAAMGNDVKLYTGDRRRRAGQRLHEPDRGLRDPGRTASSGTGSTARRRPVVTVGPTASTDA